MTTHDDPPADPVFQIYYGPRNAFLKTVLDAAGAEPTHSFSQTIHALDAANRQLTVREDGKEPSAPIKGPRPANVIVESGDYGSVNEHVVTNFIRTIDDIHPVRMFLQNPPKSVRTQLLKAFPDTATVARYSYPTMSRGNLMKFRDGYASHLIGQREARDEIVAAMYPLTRASRTRPVVLMFYGPSGVGKTETAQFINGLLGGELMRKQFSMFQSGKFASYLFGGTYAEDSLARDLLDRESGVILIDEFDKAADVFHSAFYQLFDGGDFEDKNYDVEVGPALIICTSNYTSEADMRRALGDALLSRFDALIRFQHLSLEENLQVIERIVDRELGMLEEDEKPHLDRGELLDLFCRLANGSVNVRHLGKRIEQAISFLLARAVLDKTVLAAALEPPAPAATEEHSPEMDAD